jgi:hypothetical protein
LEFVEEIIALLSTQGSTGEQFGRVAGPTQIGGG